MAPSVSPPSRWISFDCYGTLIDWETGIRRAFQELLRIRDDEEEELFRIWERIQWQKLQGAYLPYAEILRASFRETASEFGYSCPGYAVESFVESLGRWEAFPDANPALSRLAQSFRLAIISNIDRDLLGHSLRRFSVRFDALVTAEDARAYKPNPAMFRYALQRLAYPPEQVLHVAFGVDYDLKPASALGMRVIYVNRHNEPRPDLPLEAEIQSLEQLPAVCGVEIKR
ncbi:MAG: haloacid dehalogenase type II [Acidobacteria bacterium]|nr:haloacid dehalogenase type II [Acidobacteriota bacterium]